jgi:hypothetical protein
VLSSTANDQLQSQHEYKQQQYDITRQNNEETTKETIYLGAVVVALILLSYDC